MTTLMAMVSRIVTWIASLWDSTDKTTEVKLLAFGLGVLAAIAWLSAALAGNSWKVYGEWNTAFIAFCGLIAIGAIVEKASSKEDKK